MTSIISSLTSSKLIQNLSALGIHMTVSQLDGVLAQANANKLPTWVTPQMISAAKDAFTYALSASYSLIVALLLIASVVSWFMIPWVKDSTNRKGEVVPIGYRVPIYIVTPLTAYQERQGVYTSG